MYDYLLNYGVGKLLAAIYSFVMAVLLFTATVYVFGLLPLKKLHKLIKNNERRIKEVHTHRLDCRTGYENIKRDYAKIYRHGLKYKVVIEKCIRDGEYEKANEEIIANFLKARYWAVNTLLMFCEIADCREEIKLKPLEEEYEDEAKNIFEKLTQVEFFKDKTVLWGREVRITFHKYLTVKYKDNRCDYFTKFKRKTPYEFLRFIEDLIYEDEIFLETKGFFGLNIYYGYCLEKLLKKYANRSCRLYSAKNIYLDQMN